MVAADRKTTPRSKTKTHTPKDKGWGDSLIKFSLRDQIRKYNIRLYDYMTKYERNRYRKTEHRTAMKKHRKRKRIKQ